MRNVVRAARPDASRTGAMRPVTVIALDRNAGFVTERRPATVAGSAIDGASPLRG